jgi:hypothetical protein
MLALFCDLTKNIFHLFELHPFCGFHLSLRCSVIFPKAAFPYLLVPVASLLLLPIWLCIIILLNYTIFFFGVVLGFELCVL